MVQAENISVDHVLMILSNDAADSLHTLKDTLNVTP